MKNPIYSAALAALLTACAANAAAAATVTFVNPEKMTDVPRFTSERKAMEADLLAHFNTLSERLPPGQQLKIEVLDIDLAGDVFPRVSIRDVRVLKGRADFPRMHLRFTLEQDGKLISSGERHLADINYQMGASRYSTENFPYERKMLDEWFRKEFSTPR